MNTALACIPCFIRQTLEAVRFVSDDTDLHERVVREVLTLAADLDFAVPPPAVARDIHRRIRELSDFEDPYRTAKQRATRLALELYPELWSRVSASNDPLETAVRLSIAGNVIDLGVYTHVDRSDLRRAVEAVISERIYGDLDGFKHAISEAESILFIADNAGEIVFDRVFIEQLPLDRVTVAVRGAPVLNDATREDARTAALADLVPIIDTGSDAPGVLLEECGEEFLKAFEESDCVIAKGQGNYEGLSDVDKRIFFLLKVKCSVIAERTGRSVGAHLLVDQHERRKEAYA